MLHQPIDDHIDEPIWKSTPEYFASTVDVTSGRVYHLSSCDPRDVNRLANLKEAVLASIVEPAMSEAVPHVANVRGTLIDGGIRSGLPLTAPLMRGAERPIRACSVSDLRRSSHPRQRQKIGQGV